MKPSTITSDKNTYQNTYQNHPPTTPNQRKISIPSPKTSATEPPPSHLRSLLSVELTQSVAPRRRASSEKDGGIYVGSSRETSVVAAAAAAALATVGRLSPRTLALRSFNSIEFYSGVQLISLRSPLKSSLSFRRLLFHPSGYVYHCCMRARFSHSIVWPCACVCICIPAPRSLEGRRIYQSRSVHSTAAHNNALSSTGEL